MQIEALGMQDPKTELQSKGKQPSGCQEETQPIWSQMLYQEICGVPGTQGPPALSGSSFLEGGGA